VKIKGVTHEYASIPGVKDTVLDIVLNLKQIHLKKTTKEPVFLTLKVKKEGIVTAADIETPSDVTILNPEQYITTIDNKNTEFDMKIRVEKGVGYRSIAEIKKEKREEDSELIVLDASFTPIVKVRYTVTPARFGQITNLDKLELAIETTKAITPDDALKFSANLLQSYFTLFNTEGVVIEKDFVSDVSSILEKEQEEKMKEQEKERETYTPIEILNLSPRTLNALINGGIGSIEQLLKCTESKLNNLRGFGKKAMTEIRTALKAKNYKLLGDD
jgi:DNA-directed RNA polymerase subunit alpha